MARLKSGLTQLTLKMPKTRSLALLETAAAVVTLAKELCPVDTGALRQSVSADPISSKAVRVGTTMHYAPYVEYGTVHSPAQPFLTPAFAQVRPTMEAILKRNLAKTAEEVLRSTKVLPASSVRNLGRVSESKSYTQANPFSSANAPFELDESLFSD